MQDTIKTLMPTAEVHLVGSLAKGIANGNSDVDLVVRVLQEAVPSSRKPPAAQAAARG
jgi:DNA polymerase sigma